MPNYSCDRCDYKTKSKQNFKKHLYRKYTCVATRNDIPIETLRSKYYDKEPVNSIYTCDVCNKTFTASSSLKSHVCKSQVLNQETLDALIKTVVKTVLQDLKGANTIVNNNNQTINNTIINNTTNININCFLQPNIAYIPQDLFLDCYMNRDIPKILENVYCNKDHPENKSIKVVDNTHFIYENGEWNSYDDPEKELLDQGYRILSSFFRENQEFVEEVIYNNDMNLAEIKEWFLDVQDDYYTLSR